MFERTLFIGEKSKYELGIDSKLELVKREDIGTQIMQELVLNRRQF